MEILRQPRLILTLILGPFLIMLIFGIGYRNEARPMDTLFVIQAGSPLYDQIEEYAKTMGKQLVYAGKTTNREEALEQLERGAVDLVAITPDDAYTKIVASEQAIFKLYHNEIDPVQVNYVDFFGRTYVGVLNRRVLYDFATHGQAEAETIQEKLRFARVSAEALREALESGDVETAQREQQDLEGELGELSTVAGGALGILGGVQRSLGGGDSETMDANEILNSLETLREENAELEEFDAEADDYQEEIQQVEEIEAELERLEGELTEFQRITPYVLIQPFSSEIHSINDVPLEPTDFFAPSVVVLLLQHIAVTFASLSIVRERRSGTMELFRVSPLSAFETLLSKYLSYLLFANLLAGVITATTIYLLQVPILGNLGDYALALLALIFASLGIGFFLSMLAETDTQAVQYAMFLLLASVFFSGFFMDLRMLWQPVRALSWTLPATYGIQMLQNVMLRGHPVSPRLLLGLTTIGTIFFLLSWLLLRRMMRRGAAS